MEYVETTIIGAGQAGLSSSYYLLQEGLEHLVLERSNQAANNWRNVWDSFTLLTPNWAFRIPGYQYKNDERDGFMPREKVIEFFESYIKKNKLPVKFNTNVTTVEKTDTGYMIHTDENIYKSKNVIIASGFYQIPRIPGNSASIPKDILQIPATSYRNPGMLPRGAVLIAGTGASGCQIAEELNEARRKVFLCVGSAGRAPRRYRGYDTTEWLEKLGFFSLSFDQMPPGAGKFDGIPHLTGKDGGHTINLHQFYRDGIILLGHLKGAEKYKIFIAPDLYQTLQRVDNYEMNVRNRIDNYIQSNNLNVPPDELPVMKDGFNQRIIEELDLKKEKINTIIWAGGFKFNYSMVKLPVTDHDGMPIQEKGVTNYPGLYFIGMPWMPAQRSGFLLGVAESARHIVSKITETVESSQRHLPS